MRRDPITAANRPRPAAEGLPVRALAAAGVLLSLTLASGCGGGLSYTVDDKEVRTLSGDDAAKIAAAKAEVAKAKATYDEARVARATTTTDAARAEKATDRADSDVDKAADKVDRAESDQEKALDASAAKRDKALATAKAAYAAAVAAARNAFAKESQAITAKYGAVQKTGAGELKTAEQQKRLEEARATYQNALLDERKAREEEADAAVWVAKANYELAKFDALMASRSKQGADVNAQRRDFAEQVSERQSILIDRQRDVASYQKDTASALRALDKLEPKTTPSATTPTDGAAPAPTTTPLPE